MFVAKCVHSVQVPRNLHKLATIKRARIDAIDRPSGLIDGSLSLLIIDGCRPGSISFRENGGVGEDSGCSICASFRALDQ